MACILVNVLAKGHTLPRLQVWGDVIIEGWQHEQEESTDALKRPLTSADAVTGPEVQGGRRGPGKAAVPGHLAGVEECSTDKPPAPVPGGRWKPLVNEVIAGGQDQAMFVSSGCTNLV